MSSQNLTYPIEGKFIFITEFNDIYKSNELCYEDVRAWRDGLLDIINAETLKAFNDDYWSDLEEYDP